MRLPDRWQWQSFYFPPIGGRTANGRPYGSVILEHLIRRLRRHLPLKGKAGAKIFPCRSIFSCGRFFRKELLTSAVLKAFPLMGRWLAGGEPDEVASRTPYMCNIIKNASA